MTNRFRRRMLLSAAVLSCPLSAWAQTGGGPSDRSTLEAVEVVGTVAPLQLTRRDDTASRLDLTPFETPATVQVITGDAIRARGDITVYEAVSRAAGVTTTPATGNGLNSYTVRGFAGGNSVLQLFDGIQLYSGSGTVTSPADPWMVDRVDILSGPASVLYGTGAIGGVINIIPLRPSSTAQNSFRLDYGSQNSARGAFDSTGPIGQSLAYRLAGSFSRSDGYIARGQNSNAALTGSMRWEITPNLDITFSDDYDRSEPMHYGGTPLVNGAFAPQLRTQNYNPVDASIWFLDNIAQAKLHWRASDTVTVNAAVFDDASDRYYRTQTGATYVPTTGLIQRDSYSIIVHRQNEIGGHFDSEWKTRVLGLDNAVVGGVDVDTVRFKNSRYTPVPNVITFVSPTNFNPGFFIQTSPANPILSSITDHRAFYGEDRLSLTDKLSLIGGLRQDRYDLDYTDRTANKLYEKVFEATSWRVGAVYNPIKTLALYGQYSKASDPVSTLISLSPTQQPFNLSTGDQVEVGAKQQFWNGRGEWTVSAYSIVKKNLITTDPINPLIQMQVGQQSSKGLEASLSVAVTPTVRVEANGTVLRAKYDDFAETVGGVRFSRDGNRPVNVPDKSANAQVSWNVIKQLEVHGGIRYVGDQYIDTANTQVLPGFAAFDAGARWAFTEKLAVNVLLYNVTNKIYAFTSNSGKPLYARPRSVEVALTGRF